MSAAISLVVSTERPSPPFNPAASQSDRAGAILTGLPTPLQTALSQGQTTRRSRFSDDGFNDVHEEWSPPAAVTPTQAQMARQALEKLRNGPLAPAPPDRLLARLLALLSHYPAKGMSPEVEQMVALDWAEDLGEYPAWAVDQAARVWRRTRKWRPSIAEMRELCRDACKPERALADRLAMLAKSDHTPAFKAGLLRRMP